jgi:hypothetical protein
LSNETNTLVNPFASYGIQFVNPSSDSRNNLFAESRAGLNPPSEPEGFVNDQASTLAGQGVWDTENSGSLGNFFLRGPGVTEPYLQGGNPSMDGDPIFSILYLTAPTGKISGEIWDIDGVTVNGTPTSEKWVVTAWDSASGGTLIETQTSLEYFVNDSTSLDGAAWLFSFAANPAIKRLDFAFDGNKTQGVGVAFDNFETGIAPVPLPAAAWLLLSGLGGLGLFGRRRNAA